MAGSEKDKQFVQDGLEFCIDCGKKRPLNSRASCQECDPEDWEEYNFKEK